MTGVVIGKRDIFVNKLIVEKIILDCVFFFHQWRL
jgi:hypothetical protein